MEKFEKLWFIGAIFLAKFSQDYFTYFYAIIYSLSLKLAQLDDEAILLELKSILIEVLIRERKRINFVEIDRHRIREYDPFTLGRLAVVILDESGPETIQWLHSTGRMQIFADFHYCNNTRCIVRRMQFSEQHTKKEVDIVLSNLNPDHFQCLAQQTLFFLLNMLKKGVGCLIEVLCSRGLLFDLTAFVADS